MKLVIHKDFDVNIEIPNLIYYALYPDQVRKNFYYEDGSHTYESHRGLPKIHKKYIDVFTENFVS